MLSREPRLISAVHLATQKLSSTSSVEGTLREVLELCVQAVGAGGGTIYIHDPDARELRFRHVVPAEVADRLPKSMPDNQGVAGSVCQTGNAVITNTGQLPKSAARRDLEEDSKVTVRNMLTAPLMVTGMDPIGVVQLLNKQSGDFDQQDLEVIETVGAVSAMAYLNSMLREQASRAASLMGMGKVSHDIGNLAAALHSNLLLVEPDLQGIEEMSEINEEMRRYSNNLRDSFADLRDSIDKIVGYSRLISDISAGRAVRPSLKPGRFPEAVEDAAAYLEPEARRSGVKLIYDVESDGETCLFDPQFVFRIVQNLVGNAVKAVRESVPKELTSDRDDAEYGSVWVRCRRNGDGYDLEVQDSGPGMPDEVVRRILAGNAVSQWSQSGGSGWGTKIVLELAHALGGRMDIMSAPGEGATFKVSVPSERVSDVLAPSYD